jgi:type VI secretion system protein ImpJ
MSLRGRPLWFEGQLVRPQHMQQMQRWIEALLEQRVQGALPWSWGLHSLRLDASLLALGKFALESCRAVMPDGTVIDAPAQDALPEPLAVPPGTSETIVKLAVPARASDGLEVGDTGQRFRLQMQDARNSTGNGALAQVAVGVPNLRLMLDGEPDNDVFTLPLARIARVDASGAIQLDPEFVPPSLRLGAHPRFAAFAREIEGTLAGRGNVLATRVDPSRTTSGLAGMVDFALLTVINAHEPVFAALARDDFAAPADLYREALRLAGALATFTREGRRPPSLPAWRHDEPAPCLARISMVIREALSSLSVDTAIALPLQFRGQGVWVSPISDRALLSGATFVLSVQATIDTERLRATFPGQAKIGPAEAIRDLVNLQLPGIPLRPMPVAPREIPYRTETVYFELDRSVDMWRQMANTPAFIIHVGATIPGLALEFWAIRRA